MPNKIYQVAESAITFGSEVADTVDWSTENIGNGAGRQSAQWDRGAPGTAKAFRYAYRFFSQFQATPTVGAVCRLLLKTSDGTHPDNDDGTGDAAVSSINKLNNLLELRPIVVDEAAANIEMVSSGIVELPAEARYIQAVLWNATGASITNDAAETKLTLTPLVDEVQASA